MYIIKCNPTLRKDEVHCNVHGTVMYHAKRNKLEVEKYWMISFNALYKE